MYLYLFPVYGRLGVAGDAAVKGGGLAFEGVGVTDQVGELWRHVTAWLLLFYHGEAGLEPAIIVC